jgi:demethylmenaquinone methyltransferase/2-methoxy-6-polyprenyl-1,4-benzoquinol methylase
MQLRAPADPNRFARELFRGLPRRYDALAEILSLGQNRRWRRAMVDAIVPSEPRLVLDVAAGTAGVSIQLAERNVGHVIGIDLTEAMLREGQRRLRTEPVGTRVDLVAGRAEQLPFAANTFDGLTFTYLLRYVADPAATLRELARVLKPGAPIANLEFLLPRNPIWRSLWWIYTRLALPIAGGVTGGREWFEVGRFLGPSISQHYQRYPLDWTIAAWRDAGIIDVRVREMSVGGGLVMWGTKADG